MIQYELISFGLQFQHPCLTGLTAEWSIYRLMRGKRRIFHFYRRNTCFSTVNTHDPRGYETWRIACCQCKFPFHVLITQTDDTNIMINVKPKYSPNYTIDKLNNHDKSCKPDFSKRKNNYETKSTHDVMAQLVRIVFHYADHIREIKSLC